MLCLIAKSIVIVKYKIVKASNFLRGSLRQYSSYIQEENSQELSRASVEGVRREATRVQFCSPNVLLPSLLTDLLEQVFQNNKRTYGRIFCTKEIVLVRSML